MIIIADAGSTKIDWAVIDTEIKFYQSEGWNPTQHKKELSIKSESLKVSLANCDSLFYYSTGAGSPQGIQRAHSTLEKLSPESKIVINGDLLGAARALFNTKDGIAVIIGTGSNVCYYNGKDITQATPSLGYLLSDEGSGFAIGRNVLRDYFYQRMPEDSRILFSEIYGLSKDKFLQLIYDAPQPNALIARYARFLQSVDNDWKRNLIYRHFESLVRDKIVAHKNFLSVPIGFVGSIAMAYQEILTEVCSAYSIRDIKIIEKPITAMIEYHGS